MIGCERCGTTHVVRHKGTRFELQKPINTGVAANGEIVCAGCITTENADRWTTEFKTQMKRDRVRNTKRRRRRFAKNDASHA